VPASSDPPLLLPELLPLLLPELLPLLLLPELPPLLLPEPLPLLLPELLPLPLPELLPPLDPLPDEPPSGEAVGLEVELPHPVAAKLAANSVASRQSAARPG
jgi:hypothetical protein